jgi:two-component system alkaline phosphatase synthesis response regulator PhoP
MPNKVLIADNEAFIRSLIAQTLEEIEDQGTVIFSADNGLDALEIIRKEKPDLVFLDVMMPKLNGFEVCQAVKGDETLKHIFMVILTAKGQELDRLHGKQVGADIFMTKPFDPDQLIGLASRVLRL